MVMTARPSSSSRSTMNAFSYRDIGILQTENNIAP
jgi:hypothetical protein